MAGQRPTQAKCDPKSTQGTILSRPYVHYLHGPSTNDNNVEKVFTDLAKQKKLPFIRPFFLPGKQLEELPGVGKRRIGGITQSFFFVEFSDAACQWRRGLLTKGRTKYPYMQFTGGLVYAVGVIAVFVDVRAKTRKQALRLIMNHELEHVEDEMKICKKMPSEVSRLLKKEVKKNPPMSTSTWGPLFGKKHIDAHARDFQKWFAVAKKASPDSRYTVKRKAHHLAGFRYFDHWVRASWYQQTVNAVKSRDSGQAYEKLGTEIGLLLTGPADADASGRS
jgi:hypothetical protein